MEPVAADRSRVDADVRSVARSAAAGWVRCGSDIRICPMCVRTPLSPRRLSTVGPLLVRGLPVLSVVCQSACCRPVVGSLSAHCGPVIGGLAVRWRSVVGSLSARVCSLSSVFCPLSVRSLSAVCPQSVRSLSVAGPIWPDVGLMPVRQFGLPSICVASQPVGRSGRWPAACHPVAALIRDPVRHTPPRTISLIRAG